jgi:23S rRNA (pseudouridine1915-N3)-methyltransferase
MRILVIAVGRLRPPFQDDVEHYRKMLAGLARVELVEVPADERVPRRIPDRAHLVLLASDGREFDSVELSRWLEERRQEGRDLCFVIGGPRGLDLDRAHKILAGEPYHY